MLNGMARVGYARVSSVGQSLEVQIEALEKNTCDKIFSEKVSGAAFERPELERLLEYVREGDCVVVTKLDRLGRSVHHLSKVQETLAQKGVALVVLDMQLDTNTPHGKLMLQMLSAIAEFELTLRRERQMAGIEHAKAKGVKFGRTQKVNADAVLELRNQNKSMREIAEMLSCSKGTVHRLLKMKITGAERG